MARRRAAHEKWPKEIRTLVRDLANQDTPPKQHHLVPSSYLEAWQDPDVLRVSVLDEKRSFVTSAKKAAREAQFYRVESPDLDPDLMPPLLVEALLGQVEGAARPIQEKLRSEPGSVTPDEKFAFTQFLAFQATRGVATRRQLEYLSNEYYRLTYGELDDESIRSHLTEMGIAATADSVAESRDFIDGLNDGSITVRPQQATLVAEALSHAEVLAEHLFNRVWVVYQTANVLLTTDEPVLPLDGPGSDRRQRGGVASAGVVCMPLSPNRLLVMVRPDLATIHCSGVGPIAQWSTQPLDVVETTEVNRELLAHAYRWSFERPSKQISLGLQIPAEAQRYRIEQFGPAVEVGDETQALIRFFSPNRWYSADLVPPWPVDRWWPHAATMG